MRGKIALVFDGTPDSDNPHGAFGRFDARTKALIARDKGAAGILLISREAKFEDDKLTQMRYDQTLGEAAVPTFVVSRETAAAILGLKEAELKSLEDVIKIKSQAELPGRFAVFRYRAGIELSRKSRKETGRCL